MNRVILAEPSTLALAGAAIMFLLLLAALAIVTVLLIVHFLRRKEGRETKVPPTPSHTQVIPRKCPQCGAQLKPDAPEGLCPACLLQRGIATEGGGGGATATFTPPPLTELAKLFPQLEILEPIGQGGMGAVYKARQPALDRLVALKILAPRSGGDLDFTERFTREARALAKLNHPNIVAVYDFGGAEVPLGQDAQQRVPTMPLHYFIMEYVDGLNLRQIEQAGKLQPREALQIIPQICGALQFAHDEGIVHRDIKPENILLDKKGRVKIADFGLAKIVGLEAKDFRLTGARDVMGTPHYMAPEQVEHPQAVDHRADIYSLGVMFYEMLTGELPLGKFAPPSQRVQVDVRLDEVVLRSLEKEPSRRYQQASEVKTVVETIAATCELSRSQREEAQTEGAGSQRPLTSSPAPFTNVLIQWVAVGVAMVIVCLVLLLGMSSEAIGARTWDYFRLSFEILAACGSIGFLLVIYRAVKTKTAEARRAVRSTLPWAIIMVLGILFGFWSPHLLNEGDAIKSDYIGQTWFPEGDSIGITSVVRTKNQMTVKGHYDLVSHNQALLALFITTWKNSRPTPVNPSQERHIYQGRGEFELIDSQLVPGLPTVSMYADGHPFASLYFGTKAEAAEERKADWTTNETGGTETTAQILVEHAAMHLLAAIRDKDDAALKELATDERIKHWRDALPQFAFEARERFRELTGKPFNLRVSKSQVRGDEALVKCDGPAALNGKYLALFFVKTADGWKNCYLHSASVPSQPLNVWWKPFPRAGIPAATETNLDNAAVSAAKKWLALIDAGNYSESWQAASAFFRDAVTEPAWKNSMDAFRKPLGDLLSRELKSAQAATELPGAPNGQYVVLQFDTSFTNKKSATETVTFMQEKDGQWKAAGYFIK